jgi:hypothetical protein
MPYIPHLVLVVILATFEILYMLCVDTFELEGRILKEIYFRAVLDEIIIVACVHLLSMDCPLGVVFISNLPFP